MTPHVRRLLEELSDAQSDLESAETTAQTDSARADIGSISHSLWLAGWTEELEILPGKQCADAQERSPLPQHSNERKVA